MGEIPVHIPKDALLTRRQFLFLTALFGADLAACCPLAYVATHIDDYFPNNEPQIPVMPIRDPSPTAAPTKAPDKKLPVPTPTDVLSDEQKRYKVGPINLYGVDNKDGTISPAPPLFLFVKKPDGTIIRASMRPKKLEKTDNPDHIFDWDNPTNVNAAFFNVTEQKNGTYKGWPVQSLHSGITKQGLMLPGESLRENLEGAIVTQKAFEQSADSFKKSQAWLFQSDLIPGKTEWEINESGSGLINPVRIPVTIKGVMRLAPVATKDWSKDLLKAFNTPGYYSNILKFVDPKLVVPMEAGDFGIIECGHNIFTGESLTDAKPQQVTRLLWAIKVPAVPVRG